MLLSEIGGDGWCGGGEACVVVGDPESFGAACGRGGKIGASERPLTSMASESFA